MTTTTFEQQRASASVNSLAAWAMIAGAVLMLVLGIPLASLQAKEPALWQIAVLNAVSHLLLIVGVIGLALAEAIWAIADEDAAVPFYSIATLALMLGPILAGIAVLRDGRWSGWRRYTVLATGLYVPLVLMPAFALPGYGPHFAIGVWGICWLLIGLSLRAEAT